MLMRPEHVPTRLNTRYRYRYNKDLLICSLRISLLLMLYIYYKMAYNTGTIFLKICVLFC